MSKGWKAAARKLGVKATGRRRRKEEPLPVIRPGITQPTLSDMYDAMRAFGLNAIESVNDRYDLEGRVSLVVDDKLPPFIHGAWLLHSRDVPPPPEPLGIIHVVGELDRTHPLGTPDILSILARAYGKQLILDLHGKHPALPGDRKAPKVTGQLIDLGSDREIGLEIIRAQFGD